MSWGRLRGLFTAKAGQRATMAPMQKFAPYLLVAAAATCWGTTGLFNRFITPMGFTQTQMFFVRCLVPTLVLGLWLLARDRQAFRIRLRDIWMFLGSGLLSLTMFGLAYFSAMQVMPLSVAVVLLYTSPVWVMLFSAPLFHERLTPAKGLALVLVLAGAACTTGLVTGTASIPAIGFFYGIVSGVGYALYSIFGRYALNAGYKSTTITFYTTLFSTIALLFFTDVTAIPALMHSAGDWCWVIGLGLMTCLAPYLLYTKGLAGMENGTAAILATLEMVVATLVSALFFHEPFGWLNFAGIVLVLAGIVVMNVRIHGNVSRS